MSLIPKAKTVVGFVLLATCAVSAPLIPLDDFVREPAAADLHLSPDGKSESFVRRENGHPTIFTRATDSSRGVSFDLGGVQLSGRIVPEDVMEYRWVANDRLLVTTGVWNSVCGTVAANVDGSKGRAISGLETLGLTGEAAGRSIAVRTNLSEVFWAVRTLSALGDADRSVLMLDQHDDQGARRLYTDVVRVSTLTGAQTVVAENPGKVVGWGCDHDGQVRTGLVLDEGDKMHALYRKSNLDSWEPATFPESLVEPDPWILGFDRDNRHYFMTALSSTRRDAVFRVDASGDDDPSLVASDPDYDIVSRDASIAPRIGTVRLTQLYLSKRKGGLVGLSYMRDGPRNRWLDPEFDRNQQQIDRALPQTVNHCVDISDDDRRLLFFCFSDRDPGSYVLLDVEHKKMVLLEQCMPWIRPSDMARMFPVHFKARDGLSIPGYLTIPVGVKPSHLPLVVMPHGGPWVRDVWGFDPLVQFLANRGYAVLQPNFRGSPGFGTAFHEAGVAEIGGAVQRDIEDATRWAIGSGIADPSRIAIVGASFGGYSALFALGKSPRLYKCGVSIAGVTDWAKILRDLGDDEYYSRARQFWENTLGDAAKDEGALKAISPVGFARQIKAPVLIIQGKEDHTVPPDQAREMIAALKAAGSPPQSLFLGSETHALALPSSRRQVYRAIELFLQQNLPVPH